MMRKILMSIFLLLVTCLIVSSYNVLANTESSYDINSQVIKKPGVRRYSNSASVVLTNTDDSTIELKEDATDEEGKWSWISSESKLTLNGWTGKSIQANNTFNLHLKGNNIINMPNEGTEIVYGVSGTPTITADDGGKLTVNALNIVNSNNSKFFAIKSMTLNSGTVDINITATSSCQAFLIYAFEARVNLNNNSVLNISIDASEVTSSIYIGAVYTYGVYFNGGSPTYNINLKGGSQSKVHALSAKFNSLTAAKITSKVSGSGNDIFAVSGLSVLKLAEGGFIDFEGGYCRFSHLGSYTIDENSQTTNPENNQYTTITEGNSIYLCDINGIKLTKGRFEYVATKAPFEVFGGVLEDGIHTFTLPDMKVGSEQPVYGGWFNIYSVLRGYEQVGKINFEVVDGSLPEGLTFMDQISSGQYRIGGSPTKPASAGSIIIKATETIGDNRSVTFKLKWNNIVSLHTHEYTSWKTNETHHYKECTCGQKIEEGMHVYDDATDVNCNTCGYTRSTIKTITEIRLMELPKISTSTNVNELKTALVNDFNSIIELTPHDTKYPYIYYNDNGHHSQFSTFELGKTYFVYWVAKAADGYELSDDLVVHVGDTMLKKIPNPGYTYTGYKVGISTSNTKMVWITVELKWEHIHTYGNWNFNTTHHYKECKCGDKIEEGIHVYDNDTDIYCNVCNYTEFPPKLVLTNNDGSITELLADATDPNGKWTWNESSNTLTLNGWTGKKIVSGKKVQFNIHLKGENVIAIETSNENTYGIEGTPTITADDGAILTISALNITGKAHYYGIYKAIIKSGTLNFKMLASSGFTGQMFGFEEGVNVFNSPVINVNINMLEATGYGSAATTLYNSVNFNGGAPVVNIDIKVTQKASYCYGLSANYNSKTSSKVTVKISGSGRPHAISKIPKIDLGEGGFIDFEGGHCRLNVSNYYSFTNCKTTIPENNEFEAKLFGTDLYLCSKTGVKLSKGRIEYAKDKLPFEVTGGVIESGIHVFTLPEIKVGDTYYFGWFSPYAYLKGYEEEGKINFEIIEGSLPEGLKLIVSSKASQTRIDGSPTKPASAGSVTIKATETIGDKRSVTFKVKWNDIVSPHTHEYSDWKTNDTHHYKECTCGEKIEEGTHNSGNATCTSKAVCSVCSAEYGLLFSHTFNKEVVSELYKASNATCTKKATYYKTCECGEKGTEVFESGEALGHDHSGNYLHDETGHYRKCLRENCNEITEKEEHKYTDELDTSCDICDYVRTLSHVHNWSTQWHTNENEHYHICTDTNCNEKNDVENHKGGNATCTTKAVCSVCGTEYGSLLEHSYSDNWSSDENNHYHLCTCGDKKDVEEHKYTNAQDATCDECGYERTLSIEKDPTKEVDKKLSGGAVFAIVLGSVMVVGVSGLSVFWFVVKKKKFSDLIRLIKK